MKLQPLVPLWLLIPYLLTALAFVGWQFWKFRHKQPKHSRKGPNWPGWQFVRRSLLLVLPALVAIGPSVQGGISSPGVNNLDVVFVIDTTPSMGALDYAGKRQRIDGVKSDLVALAASLQGAHLEIVTFDTEANVILPLTSDATAFQTAVQGLKPQTNNYSQGSTIDKPIKLVTQELKKIKETYPEHFQLMFYMGDGEQTTEAKVKSFAPLAAYLSGGAVLGYGTATGAPMVKYTGLEASNGTSGTEPTYITTINQANNQPVLAVSQTDQAALQKISSQMKVTYADRNQGGPVDGLYQASKAALAVDKSQRVVHYLNLYWLAAVPYAGLLLWEWQALMSRVFDLRQHKDPREPRARRGGRHG